MQRHRESELVCDFRAILIGRNHEQDTLSLYVISYSVEKSIQRSLSCLGLFIKFSLASQNLWDVGHLSSLSLSLSFFLLLRIVWYIDLNLKIAKPLRKRKKTSKTIEQTKNQHLWESLPGPDCQPLSCYRARDFRSFWFLQWLCFKIGGLTQNAVIIT